MRLLMLALVLSVSVVVGATLIGRAIDTEVQDRVIITRYGLTLDCERQVKHAGDVVRFEDDSTVVAHEGEIFYSNCDRVP